jgi:16S rRNA (cytosine1402-N4)-methyltransferase
MSALAATAINQKKQLRTSWSGIVYLISKFEADMEEASFHQPVLLRETVEQLAVRPGGVYVDATVGEGGHALALLQASAPQGVVLGIDRDPRSLARAASRLEQFAERFIPAPGNYSDMLELARANGVIQADGVLLDLGFSSRQVQSPGYGLSFQRDDPLDMRFDPQGQTLTAEYIVNTYSQEELSQLLFQYGEEPRARSIARAIVLRRPIHTTGELAEVIARTAGGGRGRRRIHPATRAFQALRIAVNDELTHLAAGLRAAIQLLRPGGRLVVISYHSLEDRLVKNALAREAAGCICPAELPECVCQHQPALRLINRRIIRPGDDEVAANPRSRSARMRVAEKVI